MMLSHPPFLCSNVLSPHYCFLLFLLLFDLSFPVCFLFVFERAIAAIALSTATHSLAGSSPWRHSSLAGRRTVLLAGSAMSTAAAASSSAAPVAVADSSVATSLTAASAAALPVWSSVPYLLQQYYHDDPKKLNDFRIPELDALCEIVGAPRCYTRSDILYSSPFLPARFPSESHLRAMAARAILVSRWTELWSNGKDVQTCLERFITHFKHEERIRAFTEKADLTFDLRIHTFGLTPSQETLTQQRDDILKTLEMKGIYQPGSNTCAQRFFMFVDYGSAVVNPSREIRHVYLTREICDDKFNTLENDYRLNARTFIGPTSMPSNLSFIMSNLGRVTKNSVVYDPFVGTGSLLVSAGHFGALCIGSDLDWKILHGKTKKGPISVRDNFRQYKLKQPEILCSDLSCNQWRSNAAGFVDAIVCDPPYGVRAGARKSGRAEGKEVRTTLAGAQVTHIPTTQIYDVEDVIHDLLDQSAQLLKVGGRLIYWLPTTTDFRNDELPIHPCLRQVSVCEQVVRSHFSRRLITMEKFQPFTEERRMLRRDKTKDPPPKYANLKETIAQLSEEGPDRTTMDTSIVDGSGDGAGTPSVSFDPSSSFAPRPVSRSTLKKLAKLENIAARKQREADENGGVRPTRKQRMAAKERLPAEEWKQRQKERNMQIHQGRNDKKRGAQTDNGADAAAAAATTGTGSEVSSASASSSSTTEPTQPTSPNTTHPTKKARIDTGEEK